MRIGPWSLTHVAAAIPHSGSLVPHGGSGNDWWYSVAVVVENTCHCQGIKTHIVMAVTPKVVLEGGLYLNRSHQASTALQEGVY